MTFEELGAALRTEREKRGLGIEDAAGHLKISVRHLRALEEGAMDSLPHLAYVRGFIRSYAAYLGMAPEEIQDALADLGMPSRPPQDYAVVEPAPVRGGGKKWLGWAVALALVASAGYFAWNSGLFGKIGGETRRVAQPSPPLESQTASRPGTPAAHSPAPAASVPATTSGTPPANPSGTGAKPASPDRATASSVAASGTAGAARVQDGGNVAASARAQATAQSAQPDAVNGRQAASEGSSASAPAGSPATRAAQAAPDGGERAAQGQTAMPGQHKVIITATEECWIHSSADKTDTRQFSLRKGDTFALTFARSLELKLGNAGGVRIRYDGEAMPPPGQSGQVKTLVFPPAPSTP